MIKIPILENAPDAETLAVVTDNANANTANVNEQPSSTNQTANTQAQAGNNQVSTGRALVKKALDTFGKEADASMALDQDQAAA